MDPLLDTLLVISSSGPLEEQLRLLVQRRWKASWQTRSIAIAPIADAIADAVAASHIIATTIEGVVQGAQAVGEGGRHVVGEGEAAGEGVPEGEGGGRGARRRGGRS